MPLTTDRKMLTLSQEFLQEFEAISGRHPGFRPMHARGILLKGTFLPTPEVASLSRALHLTRPATPVVVRFSNFSGIPTTPDNDPNDDPRGCAIRFYLAEHDHTDIISHSTPYFPAGNAPDFMAMLQAIVASGPDKGPDTPIAQYLLAYPKARAFAERPKPVPSSYARETY
ncbi:MAG: catalase, partial [Bacteroidetes bacterium]|nr:catalase [Fibrella sp.]